LKVVGIIQARVGSTRLPGKVLRDIEGDTMLARVVHRLRRARLIDEVLVATSERAADDAVVQESRRCSVAAFRGDESDVLERYFRAAQFSRAEVIVRITSDCPLIDPEITDKTIRAFLDQRPDYASNVVHRTYPRGLDTEVMTMEALERAAQQARQPHEREHVTPYLYEHPAEFKILSVTGDRDYSQYRWTVDTAEDLELVRAIYARLSGQGKFGWRDVLTLLEREPQLAVINRAVVQKAAHQG
jgi:spore coat polysaccharide biosynthesis protein SpsF